MSESSELKPSKKVAIIGCGYVGKAVANYWFQKGYEVTGTTTREENHVKLEKITHQTAIMKGNNPKAVVTIKIKRGIAQFTDTHSFPDLVTQDCIIN